MARYGWLTVPKNLYENNKEDFNFYKSEITDKTVSTVEVRFPDDSNEDFRDLCKFIFDKFPDAPFNLSQEEAEGGYDFSSGVDTYIRPGKEQVDVYWNDNYLENISIEDLKKCSSFEEVQETIRKHEEDRPTDIEVEAELYNKNHLLHKYAPETKEELKALVDDDAINLGDIDTSKITDMSFLFEQSTRVDFSGIETWDVSHVKDMAYMFCDSKFNHPIDSWDVSSVKHMDRMFEESKFNQPLEKWNVKNVETMENMFLNADYSQNIDKWDIKDVTELGLKSQEKKVKSFEEALADLVKSHIEAGESLPDIGKQLKGAMEKTMLELGKAHAAGGNGR